MSEPTTRRNFLKILGWGAASISTSLAWPSCRRSTRPNIIVLFSDDQRFDTIRALGNETIQTPYLDSLVRMGTSFTNAYIMGGNSGAVCMPSRAMLLTGRSLFHIKGTGDTIPEEHVMIPELFRKHGYSTFGVGKWHNSPAAYARCFTGGAEIMFGGMSDHWNIPAYRFDPTGSYKTKTPVIEDPLRSNKITYKSYDHITAGRHSSALFADAAVDFLKNQKTATPFFLYVAFTAPHDPRSAPQEFHDMYDPERIPLPANYLPRHPFDNGEMEVRDELLAGFPRTPEEIRRHIADYYAIITHLDSQIGRILEALRQTGREQNTLVIFTGDNGLALGQHGLMGKQSVYEHSVHVPLIIRGPGIPAGERREDFCYLFEIFRTVCDQTGRAAPDSVEGRSLVRAIKDEKRPEREALYVAYKNFQRAVRTERWKLILYNVRGERHTQLFDLLNDPWETDNLAGDPSHSGRLRELTEILKSLMREADDPVQLDQPDWGVT